MIHRNDANIIQDKKCYELYNHHVVMNMNVSMSFVQLFFLFLPNRFPSSPPFYLIEMQSSKRKAFCVSRAKIKPINTHNLHGHNFYTQPTNTKQSVLLFLYMISVLLKTNQPFFLQLLWTGTMTKFEKKLLSRSIWRAMPNQSYIIKYVFIIEWCCYPWSGYFILQFAR